MSKLQMEQLKLFSHTHISHYHHANFYFDIDIFYGKAFRDFQIYTMFVPQRNSHE